jgi:hypothetical protein
VTLLSSWELWACAQHYITEHGEDAAIIAAMRCDELFEAGDLAGVKNFHAIIRRINQLLEPAQGALH